MRLQLLAAHLLLLIIFTPGLHAKSEFNEIKVVTQNLNRFYDDQKDNQKEIIYSARKYQQRLSALAQKIAMEFNFADIIAFQEVENRGILQQLSRLLNTNYNRDYKVILEEGNDVSGIDVGYLISQRLQIKTVQSLFKSSSKSKKGGMLFSRPPLMVKLCRSSCITIINVHLRSMRGLNSKQRGRQVLEKRQSQAETLARWIENFQNRNPEQYLMLLGDFNALTPSDAYVDVIGTIIGNPDQLRPQARSPDLIKRDLIDLAQRVPEVSRFSYRYRGKNQLLDYVLVSDNMSAMVKNVSFTKIDNAFSDHAAMKLTVLLP